MLKVVVSVFYLANEFSMLTSTAVTRGTVRGVSASGTTLTRFHGMCTLAEHANEARIALTVMSTQFAHLAEVVAETIMSIAVHEILWTFRAIVVNAVAVLFAADEDSLQTRGHNFAHLTTLRLHGAIFSVQCTTRNG